MSQATSTTSQFDKESVARAMRKVVNREELTAEERRALKRHEREKEERLRWQYYAAIPQKHWREMSGRQAKVINEQAKRYGLPFGGPTINLPALVKALHDFLARNAVKLAREDDELLQGSGSPALERYREERAELAKLDRMERQRMLVPRDEVRESLGRIATILRDVGTALQKRFGPGAAEILMEALDDAEREIETSLGTQDDGE